MSEENILFIGGFPVSQLCMVAINAIRANPTFPRDTGRLADMATHIGTNSMEIAFNEKIADYIPYLEYGTGPHEIPNAFGRGATVRHPGSRKHVGFIERAADDACEAIARVLNGKIIY